MTLLDLIDEVQGSTSGTQSRVIQYEDDGMTPLVIEYSRTDEEGTLWLTKRNLQTGDTAMRQIPEDR